MNDAMSECELIKLNDPNGYELAAYAWEPNGGREQCKGTVFLLHGINFHSTFEWLCPDSDNRHNQLAGSIIERFQHLGLLVVAYDHPGHGRSSGLRVYMNDFSEYTAAFHTIVSHFKVESKPTIGLGFSLGALVLIRAAQQYPKCVDHHILIAPPLSAPGFMSGPFGSLLHAANGALSRNFPRLGVMWLSKNPDPVIRDAVDKDELIAHVPIRARVAHELSCMYDVVDKDVEKIDFGLSVAVVYGEQDQRVDVSALQKFFNRVQCNQKERFTFANSGHDVLREARDESISAIAQWTQQAL